MFEGDLPITEGTFRYYSCITFVDISVMSPVRLCNDTNICSWTGDKIHRQCLAVVLMLMCLICSPAAFCCPSASLSFIPRGWHIPELPASESLPRAVRSSWHWEGLLALASLKLCELLLQNGRKEPCSLAYVFLFPKPII